ncbi:MAG: hypothetical protein RMK29_08495 [Myxococcales bacterium]|nr:hypothetical protein [Myxococcota bacterium]MDW8281734.1 hypothetical protein [Myxococcales bacterium]
MVGGALLVALLLVLSGCGEEASRPLLVSVVGLPADTAALRVGAVLQGRAATQVHEIRRSLNLFGLRLPEGSRGQLQVQLDALRADRCVIGRGFGELTLPAQLSSQLEVTMRSLSHPLCLCSATGWCWERPLPQGNHLRAVFAVSPTSAWAVGDHGTVLHFDGTSWRSLPSGTTAHLYAVWGSSPDHVWAVGERGTVLRWNGTGWVVVNHRMTVDLHAVWGFAGGEVWVAGAEGVVARVVGTSAVVPESVGTRRRLRALWGASPEHLWVAGEEGFVRVRTGGRWYTPAGARTDRDLYGLSGYAPRSLWAVGEEGTILHFVDGEARLESIAQPVTLTAVWVAGPSSGVRGEPPEVWAVGAPTGFATGVLFRRERSRWQEHPVAELEALHVPTAMHGSSAEDVWVVGHYGTILRWHRGQEQVHGARSTTLVIRSLWGSGPQDVWAVGEHEGLPDLRGALLRYDGSGWHEAGAGRPLVPLAVHGTAADDVWVVGRGGAVQHFDGTTWRPQDVSRLTRADLQGAWCGGGQVWIVGNQGTVLRREAGAFVRIETDPRYDLSSVWGTTAGGGPPQVWIGGSDSLGHGLLLRAEGDALRRVSLGVFPKVLAIAGTGPSNVWVAVAKSPLLHHDGQRFRWVETGTTRSLVGLWFFGPQEGWAVGEQGRLLFWNGTTWARLISGTNNDLSAIWGTSPTNLWAAGYGGTILRQRL